MSIKVVTDSTCDLPASIVTAYDITVLPCYINLGETSYLDGVELSRQEFYTRLPGCETPPTTSAPGIGIFVQAYETLAAAGASEVISIHVSASLSNIVNIAELASEATDAVPVTVIDSGQLTLGTGLLVLAAAQAAAGGGSAADILTLVRAKAPQIFSFAALDTLEYLRRSGRVSRIQFGLGTWLQIKPLLKMHNGNLTLERVRTRKKALERLVSLVDDLGPLEQLAVVHTHAPQRAEALRHQARHLFPGGEAPLSAEVTPAIGAHVGPGAVGLVAMRKDV
jgi:DegV family protein with EDD domain